MDFEEIAKKLEKGEVNDVEVGLGNSTYFCTRDKEKYEDLRRSHNGFSSLKIDGKFIYGCVEKEATE